MWYNTILSLSQTRAEAAARVLAEANKLPGADEDQPSEESEDFDSWQKKAREIVSFFIRIVFVHLSFEKKNTINTLVQFLVQFESSTKTKVDRGTREIEKLATRELAGTNNLPEK